MNIYDAFVSKQFKCDKCGAICKYEDILNYVADTGKPEFAEAQKIGDYSLASKYGCIQIKRGKRCAGTLKELNTASPA